MKYTDKYDFFYIYFEQKSTFKTKVMRLLNSTVYAAKVLEY